MGPVWASGSGGGAVARRPQVQIAGAQPPTVDTVDGRLASRWLRGTQPTIPSFDHADMTRADGSRRFRCGGPIAPGIPQAELCRVQEMLAGVLARRPLTQTRRLWARYRTAGSGGKEAFPICGPSMPVPEKQSFTGRSHDNRQGTYFSATASDARLPPCLPRRTPRWRCRPTGGKHATHWRFRLLARADEGH